MKFRVPTGVTYVRLLVIFEFISVYIRRKIIFITYYVFLVVLFRNFSR